MGRFAVNEERFRKLTYVALASLSLPFRVSGSWMACRSASLLPCPPVLGLRESPES